MKRVSWILLILLAIAVGVYFLLKYRANTSTAESTGMPVVTNYLVQETENTLTGIRMYDQDYHIVALERNSGGFWDVTVPVPGTADQALATEAETQINALEITTVIEQVSSLADFGLDFPAYTIKLVFTNDIKHKIEVGNSTPTGSGYYVRLDDLSIYVVSQYSLDAVLTLISNPPYLPTATPTAIIDLPTATPEAANPTP
jgi:hypothetical protein